VLAAGDIRLDEEVHLLLELAGVALMISGAAPTPAEYVRS